jgi:hypothetical protein
MPSRPQDNTHDPLGDPRTSDLYFLFEEKVPVVSWTTARPSLPDGQEYQLAIANPQEKRTFATLFNVRKKRNNANSPTKGGRGQFGWEDHEFDRMLHRNNTTRITASKSEPPRASVWETSRDPHSPAGSSGPSQPAPRAAARPERSVSNGSGHLVEGKPNFFSKNKDRVVRRVKTEEGQRERAKIQRGQEVDFELASASGLSSSSPDTSPRDGERKGDDRWMGEVVVLRLDEADRRYTDCEWSETDGTTGCRASSTPQATGRIACTTAAGGSARHAPLACAAPLPDAASSDHIRSPPRPAHAMQRALSAQYGSDPFARDERERRGSRSRYALDGCRNSELGI